MYPLASFKADMERLYTLGYRPIGLHDYIDGHIDIPAGTSPVVITFDDALRGQVDFDDNGQISPDCGAGVLEAMHVEHPDWALKATFFVLPMKGTTEYFYQKQYSQQKLQWLNQQGFEIGNHTVHHLAGIKSWPDSRVMAEFAGAQALIDQIVPGYNVDLLALPFGVFPKNQKLVITGESGGVTYHNVCALLAGAEPAPSMASKKFKPYRVPRIIPGTGRFEIAYWLDYLEKHKGQKYISDGDPNTITVAASRVSDVAKDRLYQQGLFFRSYDGTTITNIALEPPTAAPTNSAVKSASTKM
jgi:peptidoglycan/xylan/chitin deacetylase (PgdA/CDA1 family)